VTYVLVGVVKHRDSLGNAGTIRPGGVQWMTADSGIMHQEMPQGSDGKLDGFLLVSGQPLNEPIARYGPFVMNTEQEIRQALEDLRRGTFVRELAEKQPGVIGRPKVHSSLDARSR